MQIRPGVCSTEFSRYISRASRPVFICPRRHVRHAGHSVSRILTARFPHDVQAFVTYHLPVSRMFARRCRHACQPHAGYNSASRLIRIRRIPDARIMRLCFCTDACSFVRSCLRGPAYVSSIRCAYSLTAGEGLCPFEPRRCSGTGGQHGNDWLSVYGHGLARFRSFLRLASGYGLPLMAHFHFS